MYVCMYIKGIDRIPHLFSSQYMYLIKQSKREVERERNNRPPRRLLYIHRPRLDIETKTYNDDLNVFYSSPPGVTYCDNTPPPPHCFHIHSNFELYQYLFTLSSYTFLLFLL
ncbi:GSCOCG00007024001-RA-CDS [Cotesia congregata]|nr:GSCOCG00007024001-RA-CDS [Cotesia congregata]